MRKTDGSAGMPVRVPVEGDTYMGKPDTWKGNAPRPFVPQHDMEKVMLPRAKRKVLQGSEE